MLPSPDILNSYEHGKFVLSNLAAKRANELKAGAMPLVMIESRHPLTIALAEIAAGKIKPNFVATEMPIEEREDLGILTDETLPAEFGMLLPALDEAEVELVLEDTIVDADSEEHDEAAEVSLADLVSATDEEEEVAAVPSDDDHVSLTDVEEQENLEEETEEA